MFTLNQRISTLRNDLGDLKINSGDFSGGIIEYTIATISNLDDKTFSLSGSLDSFTSNIEELKTTKQDTITNNSDISLNNLRVFGDFTVDGSFNINNIIQNDTTINNEILTSNQLDISNQGTGPALKVTQFGNGNNKHVAIFNAGEEGDSLLIDSSGNTTIYKRLETIGDVSMNNASIKTLDVSNLKIGNTNINNFVDNIVTDLSVSLYNITDNLQLQITNNHNSNDEKVTDLSWSLYNITDNLQLQITNNHNSNDEKVTVLSDSKQDKITSLSDISLNSLHVLGDFVVDGSFNINNVIQNDITINNEILISTQLDISNQGTGPALKVTQLGSGYNKHVAIFNAGEEGDSLLIDSSGNTTIHKKLETIGDVSMNNASIKTLDVSNLNIDDESLVISKISGLSSELAKLQHIISDNDLSISDVSGLLVELDLKQELLTEGNNITIIDNVISVVGISGVESSIYTINNKVTDLSDSVDILNIDMIDLSDNIDSETSNRINEDKKMTFCNVGEAEGILKINDYPFSFGFGSPSKPGFGFSIPFPFKLVAIAISVSSIEEPSEFIQFTIEHYDISGIKSIHPYDLTFTMNNLGTIKYLFDNSLSRLYESGNICIRVSSVSENLLDNEARYRFSLFLQSQVELG